MKFMLVIIILELPPVPFQSNCALRMPDTADGDAISRWQVLSRACSIYHGKTRRCCMVCLMPQSQVSVSLDMNYTLCTAERSNLYVSTMIYFQNPIPSARSTALGVLDKDARGD